MSALALRYWNRETIWLVASAILLTTVIACVAMFVTAGPQGTALGIHFGADYGSFYSVGVLQNQYGIARLYDLGLQDRIIHESVPGFPEADALPFAYPPVVAWPFQFLAQLPLKLSFAVWLAISASLYAGAVALVLRACPSIPISDHWTVWLVALSFSPFAVEAWLNGQLSPVGAFILAAAIACHRNGQPVWAGGILALMLYKPPLAVLIVLMLVLGRRWQTLVGFGAGACVVGFLNVAVAGIDGTFDYVRFLGWYAEQREESTQAFRSIKYLDLTTSLSVFGLSRATARSLALLLALPIMAALGLAWHRSRQSSAQTDLAWAATLCFVPLLTNYGAIYDAALVVPGLILGADAIRRQHPGVWPTRFMAVIAVVYLAGLSSPLCARIGFQALTPALAFAGMYFLQAAFQRGTEECVA